jgi:hypothetical protein
MRLDDGAPRHRDACHEQRHPEHNFESGLTRRFRRALFARLNPGKLASGADVTVCVTFDLAARATRATVICGEREICGNPLVWRARETASGVR